MPYVTDRRNPTITFSPEQTKSAPGAKHLRYIDLIPCLFGTLFFEDWSRYSISIKCDGMYFYGPKIMPQLIKHLESALKFRSIEPNMVAYSLLHFLNEQEKDGFESFA